jgi:hypothetical protein
VSDATAHPSDTPVGFIDAEPAQPVDRQGKQQAETASRSDRARTAGYHSRFVAIYVGLALVAGVGVGALVVSILKDDKAPAKPTAAQFTPSESGELGAIQLAESIQQKYRLQNGDELVGVVASRNTLQDGNLGLIRVRYQYIQPFDSSADKDSKVVIPTDAIQYSLCGSGISCAIPGTPSAARFTLLKREGLELALRTFQNDPAVDNVAVFLRPVPADQPWEGYTMVFDRSELSRSAPGLLNRPVGATLPGVSKTVTAKTLDTAEQRRINELTRPYIYQYRYQLLGGRDALMQLQPAKS